MIVRLRPPVSPKFEWTKTLDILGCAATVPSPTTIRESPKGKILSPNLVCPCLALLYRHSASPSPPLLTLGESKSVDGTHADHLATTFRHPATSDPWPTLLSRTNLCDKPCILSSQAILLGMRQCWQAQYLMPPSLPRLVDEGQAPDPQPPTPRIFNVVILQVPRTHTPARIKCHAHPAVLTRLSTYHSTPVHQPPAAASV